MRRYVRFRWDRDLHIKYCGRATGSRVTTFTCCSGPSREEHIIQMMVRGKNQVRRNHDSESAVYHLSQAVKEED